MAVDFWYNLKSLNFQNSISLDMNDMISFFKQKNKVSYQSWYRYFLGVGSVQKSVCFLEGFRMFGATPLVSVPKRLPFGGSKKLEGTLIPKDEMAKG